MNKEKRFGAITVLCAIIGALVTNSPVGVFIGASTGFLIEQDIRGS